MGKKGRAVVVLLGMLAVLGIAVAVGAVTLQLKERDLRQAKERELMLAKAENDDLQQQIRSIRESKQQLELDMSKVKEQLGQAIQQVLEEKTAKDTLAKSVEEREKEISRLIKDLDQARIDREAFTVQISQLKNDQEELTKQISELEEAKSLLENKLLDVAGRPTVQLDKVVVTKPSSNDKSTSPVDLTSESDSNKGDILSGLSTGVEGQVVVVNREYDFIVVNMGRNQGLRIGQEMNILRDKQVLGRVKIEKIYDELSAAAILPESNKDSIREGDSVKPI